jgi:hypothetical protein
MRPELHFAVQIDTTLHRSESPVIHGFQRFALSFNRTVVNLNSNLSETPAGSQAAESAL